MGVFEISIFDYVVASSFSDQTDIINGKTRLYDSDCTFESNGVNTYFSFDPTVVSMDFVVLGLQTLDISTVPGN